MADLKSMKLSKAEREDRSPEIASDAQEEYPWGLRLNLDDDTVTKLGTPALRAGDEVMVMAKATVKDVSSHESDDSGEEINISMSLQITDMAVEEAGNTKERAESMFPSMNKDS